MRGATLQITFFLLPSTFQSTRPMRGATLCHLIPSRPIHVSIHAPHAGRDKPVPKFRYCKVVFQSTRPMRGATSAPPSGDGRKSGFNPRAPCGARRFSMCTRFRSHVFQSTRPMRGATCCRRRDLLVPVVSIHAPHAGRDSYPRGSCRPSWSFNPRAPCGARRMNRACASTSRSFNPRAPCGARLVVLDDLHDHFVFQSTRPMRGATRHRRAQVPSSQ